MKITIELNSLEELNELTTRVMIGLAQAQMEEAKKPEKKDPEKTAPESSFQKAKEAVNQLKEEAEKEAEAEAVPFEETAMNPPEEAPDDPKAEVPAYKLSDAQKAVRDLVKAKGKDVAKAVLAKYGATSASSLREENYAAAIADLKETLTNG